MVSQILSKAALTTLSYFTKELSRAASLSICLIVILHILNNQPTLNQAPLNFNFIFLHDNLIDAMSLQEVTAFTLFDHSGGPRIRLLNCVIRTPVRSARNLLIFVRSLAIFQSSTTFPFESFNYNYNS